MELLFQDDALAAFNKPPGLLMHRSDLDRRETDFALQRARDILGRRVYAVHRLDRPTSGLLLFATSPETATILMRSFEERRVEKSYLALVRGVPDEAGIIDHPLAEKPDRQLPLASPRPREAVTSYRRLGTAEVAVSDGRHATSRYALLEANPLTGRRRQIRRHLKHISHPIIGDTTYGDGRHNRLFREHFACGRLLLHALRLSLEHPLSGETLVLTAPLEGEIRRVVEELFPDTALP